MPTDAEHTAVYRENRAFLDSGLIDTNPRWAAVVAFYAAVHLVERLAAVEGIHNTSHGGPNSRESYLISHSRHRVLFRTLATLRTASEIARYRSLTEFDAAYPDDDVRTQLVDNYLARIEAYITATLGSLTPPPPPPPTATAGS